MKKLTVALIGAGCRGKAYTDFALKNPDLFEVVAVAEPLEIPRTYIQNNHNIPVEMCFTSWEDLLKLPKIADIAMICTQDRMHYAPAMAAIEKGYHILLEKPIAPTAEECIAISNAAQKANVHVLVCHVLRYTAFYKTIKNFIKSGKLGEIMNIEHTEGVGYHHQCHSFVRGNWRNEGLSAPMILAKSCHDADLMQWLISEPCAEVQSFGTRSHFRKENRPAGAPDYCLDGCPHKDTCNAYAPKCYPKGHADIFRTVVTGLYEPTDEDLMQALRRSPYGRCAYNCDNDVVDHQVVNMRFGSDKYVTFTMTAFGKGGRFTRIMGTRGELTCDMNDSHITFFDIESGKTTEILGKNTAFDSAITGGHGGGDEGIMWDLYEYLANDAPSDSITDISVSAENHLICFAAEESRHNHSVVDMAQFAADLHK